MKNKKADRLKFIEGAKEIVLGMGGVEIKDHLLINCVHFSLPTINSSLEVFLREDSFYDELFCVFMRFETGKKRNFWHGGTVEEALISFRRHLNHAMTDPKSPLFPHLSGI